MFILAIVLSLCVFATARELRRDGFVVTIDDNSLKSVQQSFEPSERLDLSGLNLQNIDEDAFVEGSKIRNVSLANNNLTQLPVLAFWALIDLEYLSLANNSLLQFQYAFGGCTMLQTLDIRNNGIRYLNKGSFYGLTEDTKILTDGNDFGQVESYHYEEPFPLVDLCIADGIVHSLEIARFKSENRHCKARYRPILHNSVSLGLEGIRGFKKGWYRLNQLNVTLLDLQLNQIDEITSELLNDLPEGLTRVNLAWNRIENLRAGTIDNRYLRDLDLRGNEIVSIELNALARTNLKELILSGPYVKNSSAADTVLSALNLYRVID